MSHGVAPWLPSPRSLSPSNRAVRQVSLLLERSKAVREHGGGGRAKPARSAVVVGPIGAGAIAWMSAIAPVSLMPLLDKSRLVSMAQPTVLVLQLSLSSSLSLVLLPNCCRLVLSSRRLDRSSFCCCKRLRRCCSCVVLREGRRTPAGGTHDPRATVADIREEITD